MNSMSPLHVREPLLKTKGNQLKTINKEYTMFTKIASRTIPIDELFSLLLHLVVPPCHKVVSSPTILASQVIKNKHISHGELKKRTFWETSIQM